MKAIRAKPRPEVDNVVGAYRDLVKAAEIQLNQALEDLLKHQHLPAEQLLEVLAALNSVELHLETLREHVLMLTADDSRPH